MKEYKWIDYKSYQKEKEFNNGVFHQIKLIHILDKTSGLKLTHQHCNYLDGDWRYGSIDNVYFLGDKRITKKEYDEYKPTERKGN